MQVQWTAGIATALVVSILIGYRYDITLWDWIKLLIVPAVIAGGGLWFNSQQREREQRIAREQREQEVEIAKRRTQDEVLQAYLDQMSQMLTDKERPLRRAQPGDDLSVVARARTLTVLARLVDPEHKGSVVQFLYESGLITRGRRFLDLSKAELFMADLRSADLRSANLHGTYMVKTNLFMANLTNADLSGAALSGADLIRADLSEANLSNAQLSHADLTDARGLTDEQIAAAKSLKGATMPNGQKYEDWLKGRGEDEDNSGTS